MNAEIIKVEIDKLKKIKEVFPHHSFFGDDNYAVIDAQIDVLENDLDENEVSDKYDMGHEYDAAILVVYWLDGEENESPSEGW